VCHPSQHFCDSLIFEPLSHATVLQTLNAQNTSLPDLKIEFTAFLLFALQSSVQEVYSKLILLLLPRTVCVQTDVPGREASWG